MRVLHVETGRHMYGGALQVRYLIEGLFRLGVENHLAAPTKSAIAIEAAPFCTVHETPMAGDLDIFFCARLIRTIVRIKPDILHVHSRRGADIWGAVAARLTGIPGVVTRRVDNPERAWQCRLKYRSFQRVVAISDKIAQVLASQGVDRRHITRIHSAVDASRYTATCDGQWFRSEFDLKPSQPVIGVIAQLIERKGHRDLIEAIPRILREQPGARFLFFGRGPGRRTLEDLCRSRGVRAQVTFAGFRPDLERILPCLTLVVHPAKMEGLGVSLIQASAAGIPIVACKAGGVPEVVEPGVTGLLVSPGEPEALADAVLCILRRPDFGVRMGENGRRRALSRFSTERMVEQYLDVYQGLREKSRLIGAKGASTKPFHPTNS